jgi:hypothetical protein
MVKTFRVKNWGDFLDKLFYDTHDDRIDRFRSPYIYRGLNLASDRLTTSLHRLGGDIPTLEKHLLRNFRKYAHTSEISGGNTWNWLALALTDLESFNEDGVIWALNYVNLNKHLPEKLKIAIEKERSNTFTVDMLEEVCKDLDELDRTGNDPFVLFLEPPSLDERILNQYALFSLMSDSKIQLEDWLHDDNEYYFKIIIPKELKWEFRDKLDQANITERVLKPGLDGLSQWLKRHYSSKS